MNRPPMSDTHRARVPPGEYKVVLYFVRCTITRLYVALFVMCKLYEHIDVSNCNFYWSRCNEFGKLDNNT